MKEQVIFSLSFSLALDPSFRHRFVRFYRGKVAVESAVCKHSRACAVPASSF